MCVYNTLGTGSVCTAGVCVCMQVHVLAEMRNISLAGEPVTQANSWYIFIFFIFCFYIFIFLVFLVGEPVTQANSVRYIFIYVCVYVYMYIYIYITVYICIYVHILPPLCM